MKYLIVVILLSFYSTDVLSKTIQVKMLNVSKDGPMAFEPGFIKANIGDVVEFMPIDPGHGSSSLFVPEGAKKWKGELDEKISTHITKEGVYLFECSPHSQMGMVGVIQVGDKLKNLANARKVASEYSEKFIMNKERFDKYLSNIK